MGKLPRFIEVDGYRLPPSFVPEVFRSAVAYKPENGAVVVATYPKCGTTWTMQIVNTILRKGKACTTAEEYFLSNPFLEMTGEKGMQLVSKPYCIKTHLPFDRINYNPEAKYIYVMRHPSDVVVSFYHHTRFFPIYFFSDGLFNDYFELFINGEVDFGDYFDHVISWYKKKGKSNILFLTFESLKADTKSAVLEIAHFLGEEYYDMLMADDEAILKDVLHCSSLDYMRKTINEFWRGSFADNVPPEEIREAYPVAQRFAEIFKEASESGHHSIGEFIRKGDVGDGKIMFSADQEKKMEAYIKKKTIDYPDLMNFWKKE